MMRRARGMLRPAGGAGDDAGRWDIGGFAPSAAWRTLPGGLFGCPHATETRRWEVIGLAGARPEGTVQRPVYCCSARLARRAALASATTRAARHPGSACASSWRRRSSASCPDRCGRTLFTSSGAGRRRLFPRSPLAGRCGRSRPSRSRACQPTGRAVPRSEPSRWNSCLPPISVMSACSPHWTGGSAGGRRRATAGSGAPARRAAGLRRRALRVIRARLEPALAPQRLAHRIASRRRCSSASRRRGAPAGPGYAEPRKAPLDRGKMWASRWLGGAWGKVFLVGAGRARGRRPRGAGRAFAGAAGLAVVRLPGESGDGRCRGDKPLWPWGGGSACDLGQGTDGAGEQAAFAATEAGLDGRHALRRREGSRQRRW